MEFYCSFWFLQGSGWLAQSHSVLTPAPSAFLFSRYQPRSPPNLIGLLFFFFTLHFVFSQTCFLKLLLRVLKGTVCWNLLSMTT